MIYKAVALLSFFAGQALAAGGTNWGYIKNSPTETQCGQPGREPCDPWNWGQVNSACVGDRQSPVHISNAVPDPTLHRLDLVSTGTVMVTPVNTGNTLKLDFGNPGAHKVTFKGTTWELVQFHFHHPSEHAIGGGYYDAELHLVHYNAALAEYLVIGVFLDSTPTAANNTAIVSVLDAFTTGGVTTPFSAYDLLPGQSDYYNYPGSFTTPPCTPIVTWIVMANQVKISTAQLDEMKMAWAAPINATTPNPQIHPTLMNNERPLQPLMGRTIGYYAASSAPAPAPSSDCDCDKPQKIKNVIKIKGLRD